MQHFCHTQNLLKTGKTHDLLKKAAFCSFFILVVQFILDISKSFLLVK